MDYCSLQVKVRVAVRDRLRVQSAIEGISMGDLADRLLDEGLASVETKVTATPQGKPKK